MIVFFLLVIVIATFILGVLVYPSKQYKKTTYYQITKKPYWFMDKGTYGEYLIYKHLRPFENAGSKLLFNIYLPKSDNQMSEIDVLMICPKGLFVFESKNYSGWIFGNETHRNWTQILPKGRGRSHKERFYNPIMQNHSHITHLMRLIREDIPAWSIIAFSDACTLKEITIRSENVHVINRHNIAPVVTQIFDRIKIDVLTDRKIDDIYNKLYSHTQVNHEIREQHAKSIKSYY